MASNQSDQKVLLDLNCPAFQDSFFNLGKTERHAVIETLKKIRQLTWAQVYRDQGLKWEKITSIRPPAGIDAVYSLRISQSRRATAIRVGNYMQLTYVAPDHDSTYGRK
jgi:hypothetical protein